MNSERSCGGPGVFQKALTPVKNSPININLDKNTNILKLTHKLKQAKIDVKIIGPANISNTTPVVKPLAIKQSNINKFPDRSEI